MLLTPQLTTLNELYGDVTIPADVTEGAGGTAAGAQTATTATGTTAVAAPLVKALTGLTLQTDDPLKRTVVSAPAARHSLFRVVLQALQQLAAASAAAASSSL
jgi:hypothetical protein